jgi:hypothetical protein
MILWILNRMARTKLIQSCRSVTPSFSLLLRLHPFLALHYRRRYRRRNHGAFPFSPHPHPVPVGGEEGSTNQTYNSKDCLCCDLALLIWLTVLFGLFSDYVTLLRASPPVCRNHIHNHKQRGTYEHMIGSKNHKFQTNHKLYGYGELSKSSPTGKP